MKEDYLWDKTGTDPAIEKLESALRVFSYETSAQPAVPVEIIPEKKPFWLRFAPLAFAMASLVIAAVAWGVWMQFSRVDDQTTQADIGAPSADTPPSPVPGKPAPPYIDNGVEPKDRQIGPVAKISARRPKPARGSRTVLRTIVAESKPKFTKEEIYAYDQLVLALSITSDKLGQVREKAIGEQNNYQEK